MQSSSPVAKTPRPPLSRSPSSYEPVSGPFLVERYRQDQFAMPRTSRSMVTGQKLFTDEHKRLISVLRAECVGLKTANLRLEHKVNRLQDTLRTKSDAINDLWRKFTERTTRANVLMPQVDALSSFIETGRNAKPQKLRRSASI